MNHLSIYVGLKLYYITLLNDNPAYNCVFHPLYKSLYEKNKKCIKSMWIKNTNHVEDKKLLPAARRRLVIWYESCNSYVFLQTYYYATII